MFLQKLLPDSGGDVAPVLYMLRKDEAQSVMNATIAYTKIPAFNLSVE